MTKIQAITADNKLRQATTENPVTLRAMRDLGLYATITNNRQRQGRLPVFGSLDCPFRAVRLPLWEKAGSVRPRRGRALDRSFPHPATAHLTALTSAEANAGQNFSTSAERDSAGVAARAEGRGISGRGCAATGGAGIRLWASVRPFRRGGGAGRGFRPFGHGGGVLSGILNSAFDRFLRLVPLFHREQQIPVHVVHVVHVRSCIHKRFSRV